METIFGHSVFWGLLALVLFAITLSGKLEVKAANNVLIITWVLTGISVFRASVLFGQPVVMKVLVTMFVCSLVGMGFVRLSSWMTPQVETPKERIVSEIEYIAFGQPSARFYQAPPVAFERLDTQAYVSFTNLVGRPLAIRDWSFSIMIHNKWVKLNKGAGGGFEPYAFGILFPDRIVRFDLRKNGFDYVMRERQLAVDENFEGWLFFNSGGLTEADMKKVQKSDITLVDSAGEKFRHVSDYHPKVIAIPTQLRFLPPEPIPKNLREEPPYNKPNR